MELWLKVVLMCIVLVISFLAYRKMIIEHGKQKQLIQDNNRNYNESKEAMAVIVSRNKLKNRGTNIDNMVEYLMVNGIEARIDYGDED